MITLLDGWSEEEFFLAFSRRLTIFCYVWSQLVEEYISIFQKDAICTNLFHLLPTLAHGTRGTFKSSVCHTIAMRHFNKA